MNEEKNELEYLELSELTPDFDDVEVEEGELDQEAPEEQVEEAETEEVEQEVEETEEVEEEAAEEPEVDQEAESKTAYNEAFSAGMSKERAKSSEKIDKLNRELEHLKRQEELRTQQAQQLHEKLSSDDLVENDIKELAAKQTKTEAMRKDWNVGNDWSGRNEDEGNEAIRRTMLAAHHAFGDQYALAEKQISLDIQTGALPYDALVAMDRMDNTELAMKHLVTDDAFRMGVAEAARSNRGNFDSFVLQVKELSSKLNVKPQEPTKTVEKEKPVPTQRARSKPVVTDEVDDDTVIIDM